MYKIALGSFAAFLLCAAPAAAEPGSAFIQQVAAPGAHAGRTSLNGSSATADQNVGQTENLIQALRSRLGALGGTEIDQRGDFLTASIFQAEGSGNIAAIEQRGIRNMATLTQLGTINTLLLSQTGNSNTVLGTQSGNGNYAHIDQRSNNNNVHFTQSGTGNILAVVQD